MESKSARIQLKKEQIVKANVLDLKECRAFIARILADDTLPDDFYFEEQEDYLKNLLIYRIQGPNDLVEEFKRKFMEIAKL